MPTNDDMPALESWLREKAPEAHNKCESIPPVGALGIAANAHFNGQKKAFESVLAKIQSGHVNQRPHVSDKI